MQPTGFNTYIVQKMRKDGEPPSGEKIARNIVAFARMSAGNPDTVHAATEGLENIIGLHAPGTGNPNDTDVGRIRHPSNSCQISGTVRAPITQKSRNTWFKCLFVHSSSLCCSWETWPEDGNRKRLPIFQVLYVHQRSIS